MCPHLGNADIGFGAALQNLGNLALQTTVTTSVHYDHLDTVALQCPHRIALMDKYILFQPLDLDVDRAAGNHIAHTLVVGQVAICQTVFMTGALLDNPLVVEAIQNLQRLTLSVT